MRKCDGGECRTYRDWPIPAAVCGFHDQPSRVVGKELATCLRCQSNRSVSDLWEMFECRLSIGQPAKQRSTRINQQKMTHKEIEEGRKKGRREAKKLGRLSGTFSRLAYRISKVEGGHPLENVLRLSIVF